MKRKNTLSLEERLKKAANSSAASPESAARKVMDLAEVCPAYLMTMDDLELLHNINGEYWEDDDIDIMHYGEFCRIFPKSFDFSLMDSPFGLDMGLTLTNGIISIALMFLDNAKNKKSRLYPMLHMNLGDFWHAVRDTCYDKTGTKCQSRYDFQQKSMELFMEGKDDSTPIKNAIANLLHKYELALNLLNYYEHILKCESNFQFSLKQQEECDAELADMFEPDYPDEDWDESTEEEFHTQADNLNEASPNDCLDSDKGLSVCSESYTEEDLDEETKDFLASQQLDAYLEYINPFEFYFQKIEDYNPTEHTFESDSLPINSIRRELLMKRADYSPEALKQVAKSINSPDFRDFFLDSIREKELAYAMKVVNESVSDLFLLLVSGFINIRKYHYINEQ